MGWVNKNSTTVAMYSNGGKTAAWQRTEGKSESGGLNEEGRKSYEKEINIS